MSVPRLQPLDEFGAPPRVVIRKVVRTQYRLEWQYDGREYYAHGDYFEGNRKQRTRYVSSIKRAYRMAALRLIFVRRDQIATGTNEKGFPSGCAICDAATGSPEDQPHCRYHYGPEFDRLVARLARWLCWADSRGLRGAS